MSKECCKSYSFKWKIQNFLLLNHEKDEFISSPVFIFENLFHSVFQIKLYPKGTSVAPDYLSVILSRDDNKESKEVLIDYRIEMKDGNSIVLNSLEVKDSSFKGKDSKCEDRFIKIDKLTEEMIDWKEDSITLSCELKNKMVEEPIKHSCETTTKLNYCYSAFEMTCNVLTPSLTKAFFQRVSLQFHVKPCDDSFQILMEKLTSEDGFEIPPKIFIRISLLDIKGFKTISKRYSYQFRFNCYEYERYQIAPFFTKSVLEDKKKYVYLQENEFRLKFELFCPEGKEISVIKYDLLATPYFKPDSEKMSVLQSNWKEMFLAKKYCDVNLRVEDEVITAHKVVLAARSPVFSIMFDQNMIESKTGIVEIQDMSADTVNNLLEYMYTGLIKELNYEEASSLLFAADKYEVVSLKEKCSYFLISMLSESNACDLVTMAELIDFKPLKTSAIDYFKKNYQMIMQSPKWSEWVEKNNKLASEIILELSSCLLNHKFFTDE